MIDALKDNPVRLYAVASAVLALAANYYASLPVPLILGVVAALLGLGETVRSKVAPMSKVVVHAADLADGQAAYIAPADAVVTYEPQGGEA